MTAKMIITAASRALRRLKGKSGQSLVEYTLILSFISVLTVALTTVLGQQIQGLYQMIINALSAAFASV